MSKYYAHWYGGGNYSAPSMSDNPEYFDSLEEIKREFWSRRHTDLHYPLVGGESEYHVFKYDPRQVDDAYPDYVISFGPRGGVRVESTWSNGRNWGVK